MGEWQNIQTFKNSNLHAYDKSKNTNRPIRREILKRNKNLPIVAKSIMFTNIITNVHTI
jgi:hypothetical protein